MANTALITGASGGIGAGLARLHAKNGDNLVLVARSRDKLEAIEAELAAGHGTTVMIITEDLSAPGAAQKVFQATQDASIDVDGLVNNAGVGGHGKFHERDLAREEAMIQLNVAALTSLTHLYLQGMVQRGRGRILNVASTAGLIPGPLQAVYYATKAYVVSFSQSIAEELSGTGVTVTALCPGPVQTDFVARADLEGVALFKKPAASAESVARCGFDAMQRGDLMAFNDPSTRFLLNWVTPLLPRKTALKMSRKTMEKSA